MQGLAGLPGYERLDGGIPVVHPPGMEGRATELRSLLEAGTSSLSEILGVEPPELEALLVADGDWEDAPRDNARPYPLGLPYFTRAVRPPALVLPETLSPAFQPRTLATEALVVWHELAHAYLLREPLVRAPSWLREFVPQTLSAAVAKLTGLPLEEHLAQIGREPGLDPGFTVRGFSSTDAERQMAFQNLLLLLGAAAVERFGDGFLSTLAQALWEEREVLGEERGEELLAGVLGPGGWEWLFSRPEF
jgi:hypothetical protein